jgi:hypothetical protein
VSTKAGPFHTDDLVGGTSEVDLAGAREEVGARARESESLADVIERAQAAQHKSRRRKTLAWAEGLPENERDVVVALVEELDAELVQGGRTVNGVILGGAGPLSPLSCVRLQDAARPRRPA